MEHIDDIIVILEAFNQTINVFLLLGSEFTHGEGNTLKLETLNLKTLVLEELGDGTVVLEVSIDENFILIAEHLVDVAVDKFKLKLVHVDTVLPGDNEGTLALEEEVVHTHGTQFTLATHKGGTEVGNGTSGVVGGSLDNNGGAVRSLAVIDDLFVGTCPFRWHA